VTREISIAFQTDKIPAQYIALAKLIDSYDFDAVSVYCDAPFHPSYGPLLLMAPHIHRARLGPAAVSPFRTAPIDIAANTALLADLAQGGVYIGMVRGAWLADHGIFEPNRPITAMREAVQVVRYLLAGKTGGVDGDIFRLAEHVQAPYPIPNTPVPLMIGTWGPKLAALAGKIADEVKVGGSANPDMVRVMQSYIAKGAARAGRADDDEIGVAMGAVTVIDEDREKARRAARRSAALYLPVVAPLDPTLQIAPDLIERLRAHANRAEWDEAAALISDDLLNRFAFAGNAADLIRQAEALFNAGASRIEFGTPHGLPPEKGIRLLGEEVLPALR
jgi:5,10-methylenetetrahydromethanopterin reductase